MAVTYSFRTWVRYLLVFILGFACCYILYPRTVSVQEYRDRIVQGTGQTENKTEIVYIPKASTVDANGKTNTEKTDLELIIPKQELNIKINGQIGAIHKADDERYLFEKNKIQLEQKSKADINILVPTVDYTKRWSVGVGYGSHGFAGTLDFPLYKSLIGGWIYTDRQTKTIGVKINF